MDQIFDKYIIAKYSPKNYCHVADGELLIVLPLRNIVIKKDTQHHFVSAIDLKTKSKYGWVKRTSGFTLNDFISKYLKDAKLVEIDINVIEMMLKSVAKLSDDTAVTTDYSIRGLIQREAILTVHKVFFYKQK